MLNILTSSKLRKIKEREFNNSWGKGLAKGYELGYKMGQAEKTNRGFIISSQVDEQLSEILKEKGIL